MATLDDEPTVGNDTNEVFDVDAHMKEKAPEAETPLYRIYKGSRIAISKATGQMWKKKLDAAKVAYEAVYEAWDQTMMYYNNNQTSELRTSKGLFKRGDSTENIVYSNLNVMLPAVYGKDPDIAVNTVDKEDDDFVSVMKSLLNVLMRGKNLLNAKPKIKRAAGFGLLTNFGVLKIDWTKKDDSVEFAMQELQKMTKELAECKDSKEVEEIYGKIEALESQMEVFEKSGPRMSNVLSHNLLIDPETEDQDGMDAKWMSERIFFKTAALVAQFTQPCEDDEGEGDQGRVLVYKPTHRASFTTGAQRDDGLGMVLDALSVDEQVAQVAQHETPERAAYRNLYYTECYLVWDKTLRRVMLFHKDDWTWPLWVWDDPLMISRFFPYFIISFGMSTGGLVSVGETAYYLDQQDEINDINRQVSKIRRSVFNYFFYNSDVVDKDQAEKFLQAVRGEGKHELNVLGVRAGEKSIKDMIQAFIPPSFGQDMAPLFNKEPILNTINRISNTSDALRGTQYKTNTNEAAVQSYQDAARMAVGAKIDVIEDAVSDFASALAELCVQNYTTEDVAGLVGKAQAKKWKEMGIDEFRANFNMECVAGTTEKPNSAFKKKEAIQVSQTIGQFASAAPVTSMTIMLRVLEQAFTEVNVRPEDWDMLREEAKAQMQKGVSTGGGGEEGGGGDMEGDAIQQKLMSLPPEDKQKVVQMKQQGVPDEQIKQFLLSKIGAGGGAPPQQVQQQPAP